MVGSSRWLELRGPRLAQFNPWAVRCATLRTRLVTHNGGVPGGAADLGLRRQAAFLRVG